MHCFSLPKDVKRRLKALKRIQSEIFTVEAQFFEEVHELELKFESIYAPLYKQASFEQLFFICCVCFYEKLAVLLWRYY